MPLSGSVTGRSECISDTVADMPKKPAMSPSGMPVGELLGALPESTRGEARAPMAFMGEVTGEDPVVWASRIIGYGQYRYRCESGHEGLAPLAGSLRAKAATRST